MKNSLLVGILIGMFAMWLISKLTDKCFGLFEGKETLDKVINTLVRQSARWSEAAKQDENSMIRVLHANYGAGYLWALTDIATSEQIEDATGIDYLKFRDEIVKVQDNAVKGMAVLCPEFVPPPSVLTTIGGEGV